MTAGYKWSPITDLPPDVSGLTNPELATLHEIWIEQKAGIEASGGVQEFNEQLHRQWAIETGIIEQVYSLDRGITQLLIEKGIDASLIPSDSTDKPPELVASIISDHKQAIEGLFDFVKGGRALSSFYIRELHALLTRHQQSSTAVDQFGNLFEVPLEHGAYKRVPNNPKRNGRIHEYCPPEHVAAEMDRLIALHHDHETKNLPSEVQAAWLHHRFTQIHPFQDGNGRVARALASLVFVKAQLFPLTLTRDDRDVYIGALESADQDRLEPLLTLFSKVQKRTFVKALGIAGQINQYKDAEAVIDAALDVLQKRQLAHRQEFERAKTTAKKLQDEANKRLSEIATKLQAELGPLSGEYRFRCDSDESGAQSWHSYSRLVIKIANTLGYHANLSEYHAWSRLILRTDRLAEVLVSFHGIGQEYRGVLAVSMFFFGREETLQPASDEVFQINYREHPEQAKDRFVQWFEPAITKALEIWRTGL